MTRTIHVKTTVDLPGPSFRGVRIGETVYISLSDLLDHLAETADAFDKAHAEADFGRSFRAYRDAIEKAPTKEFR